MRNKNKQWLVALMTTLAVGCASIGATSLTSANAESKSADSYVTAGENVTVTAAGKVDSGLVGGVSTYMQRWNTGLKVSSSAMSGTVMSNAIDMAKVGNDTLIRFFPADMCVKNVTLKVIDVSNVRNSVTISYVSNGNMKYENGTGTMYVGVNTTITYNTAEGEVTTSPNYEAGQVLGTWWPFAWVMGKEGGFGGDIGDGDADGWINKDNFHRFSVSYADGAIKTTKGTKALEGWTGFGGTNVYLQLSWESTENNSGLLIDYMAGLDFATAEVDGGDKISTVKADIPSDVVEFTADTFVTAGENVTVTAATGLDDGLAGGVRSYMQQWNKGMKASSSTTSGTVMSNAVNLSEVGNSPLVRFFPADMSVKDVEVRLIDSTNTNNVVVIKYVQNDNMKYTNGVGTMSVGVNTSVTYQTANGYVSTSAYYESGQVLGTWWPFAWIMGNEGGFGGDIGDGWTWINNDHFHRFTLSYADGAIKTTKATHKLENWTGFGGDVYVQLSWNSTENNSGLLIDCLAGIDFTASKIEENTKISAEKAEIPEAPVITSAPDFVAAGENVTLAAASGLNGGLAGGVRTYMQQWAKGLKATSSTKSGVIMSNAIDMSKVGNETLLRFYPADMSVETVTVRIIDAANTNNVVVISYVPNKNMTYTNDVGTMYVGVNTVVTYKTENGYVSTVPTYEPGQVLGTWWPYAWIAGNQGGMGADIGDGDADGWINNDNFHRFSLAYVDGALKTTKASRTLEGWTGFGGANVYVELSWTSKDANSGLLIDCLAGIDFTVVTVDGGDKISTKKAAILTCAETGHANIGSVTAPTCTAAGYTTYTCAYCGESSTGNEVAATGHNYSSTVTDPTCTAVGYTTYNCTVCGHS